jgi:hypothetical protein
LVDTAEVLHLSTNDMKNKILIAFAVLAIPVSVFASSYGVQTKTSGCTANQALQDPACTAGAVFSVGTTTICTVGYTTQVRDVPLSVKKQVFAEYGIDYSLHANYEVDHLISLELGGSNDISNLWPESYLISDGSHSKDGFENYLHNKVCKGIISLTEAQREISSDWLTYYTLRQMVDGSYKPTSPTAVSATTTTKTTTTTTTSNTSDTAPAVKKAPLASAMHRARPTTPQPRHSRRTRRYRRAWRAAAGCRSSFIIQIIKITWIYFLFYFRSLLSSF